MIKNYIKVAFRSIFRNKMTAIINICGLALAMACSILIYLFVVDELNYDRQHPQADRTYRVTRIFYDREGTKTLHLSSVAPPVGPLLKNDFGEIEKMARSLQFNTVISKEKNGEIVSNTENEVFVVEPALFEILNIEVTSGDPATDLQRPFTIMLSEPAAMKYFNTLDVRGQRLLIDSNLDLEVVGVFKPFPLQTHLHPDFFISFSTLENDQIYGKKRLETNWGNNAFATYLVLEEGADAANLTAQFPAFLDKHYGSQARADGAGADFVASKTTELTLQKITDIHLRSHLDDEIEVNGNINNVYMMGVIGVFIILIACFNFINLSTARATKRAKEVGLRKVVGAFRNQLIFQYLSESVLLTLMSLVIAIALGIAALPWLNQFTGKGMSLAFVQHPMLYALLLSFAIVVGLFAGLYPAFVVSSFKPALVLKGTLGTVGGKGGIRKGLVVAQFAISIVLLIATIITLQQLNYLNNRRLGYERDQVVTLTYYNQIDDTYDSFYNELQQSSTVVNVGRSSRIPTGRLLDSMGGLRVTVGDSLTRPQITLKYVRVDDQFFDTYGVPVAAGRLFSKSVVSDTSAFIINEAAARAIGWKTNEEAIDTDFEYGGVKGKLIGIVRDFHFESLHQRVAPMVFLYSPKRGMNFLAVKIAAGDVSTGVAHIEKVWRSVLPDRPFEYQFLDDRYSRLYESEQKESTLFTVFAGLAIFIACLGLFGLATFNTMQRLKEIGIRKVLGATVPGIVKLLSMEIIWLIVFANLIAWPVGWYLMNLWLDSFAYHVNIQPLIFLLSALAAVAIALLTVSAQTIRAAMSNPARTLKYE